MAENVVETTINLLTLFRLAEDKLTKGLSQTAKTEGIAKKAAFAAAVLDVMAEVLHTTIENGHYSDRAEDSTTFFKSAALVEPYEQGVRTALYRMGRSFFSASAHNHTASVMAFARRIVGEWAFDIGAAEKIADTDLSHRIYITSPAKTEGAPAQRLCITASVREDADRDAILKYAKKLLPG